jgi:hypothetical protein
MGLDINGMRFLLYAKRCGVDFSKSAMIGRQFVYLGSTEFSKILNEFKLKIDAKTLEVIFRDYDGYAEGLLEYIGAKEIHSFDASKYEKATHIHDMNFEIDRSLHGQYTMVLDGGTLEHVFNFPTAIKNCMEMVGLGGHYLAITPANNLTGHGFYQFSPELFFHVFTPENGFDLVDVLAFETTGNTWYSVKSPHEVSSRVTIINNEEVYLLIIAKRVKIMPIFSVSPQQVYYASMWEKGNKSVSDISMLKRLKSRVRSLTPVAFQQFLRRLSRAFIFPFKPSFKPVFFEEVDPLTRKIQ